MTRFFSSSVIHESLMISSYVRACCGAPDPPSRADCSTKARPQVLSLIGKLPDTTDI